MRTNIESSEAAKRGWGPFDRWDHPGLRSAGNFLLFLAVLWGSTLALGAEKRVLGFMTGGTESDRLASARSGGGPGPQAVFLGSSYTFFGVRDHLFQKETGMFTENFAFTGFNFSVIQNMFYKLLERNQDVELVIVEVITDEQIETDAPPESLPASQIEALRTMIDFANQRGVEVVLVFPPSTKSAKSSGGLEILDFDDPATYPELFEPDARMDETHLNAQGAALFTRLIARSVRSRLAGRG